MGKSKDAATPTAADKSALATHGPQGRKARAHIVSSGNSQKPAPAIDTSKQVFPGHTGKLPLNLLRERCNKLGWSAEVEAQRLGKDRWTCKCVLKRRNLKSGAMDEVILKPPSSIESEIRLPDCGSAAEARQLGSVYALYRFSNSLRLELQMPPTCRDYWRKLEAEKKASPKNKAWLWAEDPFQAASNAPAPRIEEPASSGQSTPSREIAKPVALSKGWQEAPEVRMSSDLRELVETTIRDLLPVYPEAALPSNEDDTSSVALTSEEQHVLARCTAQGFRQGHSEKALVFLRQSADHSTAQDPIVRSLLALPLQQAVEQYLQIHISEDDLPAHLRHRKPADANARVISSASDSDALKESWAIDRIVALGFPRPAAEEAYRSAEQHSGLAIDLLLRRLAFDETDPAWGQHSLLDTHHGDLGEMKERREEEVLALEAIYGSRFRWLDDDSFAIAMDSETDRAPALRIDLHDRSRYPSMCEECVALPTMIVTSDDAPPYIVLHLTATLLRACKEREDLAGIVQAGQGGLISELVELLSTIWERVSSHPPDFRAVLRPLVAESANITRASTPQPQPNGKPTKRTRQYRPVQAGDSAALQREYESCIAGAAYKKMLESRKKLPAWSMQQDIIDLVTSHRVSIVMGETGSGKTTQVPTFILDKALSTGKGGTCSIIVTQPRRVSAISVATRVAQERAETINSPHLVGYTIRGERKASPNCRLMFVTTGVLLRRLANDPQLAGVSHVVVDEVHERSLDSDLLLLELKHLLASNKHIKIVLMSATVDQALFAGYFNGAPCISLQGLAYPVQDFYLEDYLPTLGYVAPSTKPSRKYSAEEIARIEGSFKEHGVTEPAHISTLAMLTRSGKIDYGLIEALVSRLLIDTDDGAILIFMTGVAEIARLCELLRSTQTTSTLILPLHSNLSNSDQGRVFVVPPKGTRKIVVATNIAETSITIPDVVYVIDSGRVKENAFDPQSGLTRLVEQMTSKASSKQRRGRAGRVQAGQCYKLFSRYTEQEMADHALPEMLRTPLDSIVLGVMAVREHVDPRKYLSQAISPPSTAAIDQAWNTLLSLGAITGKGKDARITPLGRHLSLIPVDLKLGKMLVLGSIFRCIEPVVTGVACLASKPLFLNNPETRDEAQQARQRFAKERSDVLTSIAAFNACKQLKGRSALQRYCSETFISASAVMDIEMLQREFMTSLEQSGIISGRNDLNANAESLNLVKAILFAGTGNLARVQLPDAKYIAASSGNVRADHEAREVKFFDETGRVFIHPGSTLFGDPKLHHFVTYFSKALTTKPFIRDVTEIPLYAVLLFGGEIEVDFARGGLKIITQGKSDAWVRMRAWGRIGILATQLKRLLDAELDAMIESPESHASESSVIYALLRLLQSDGR
ncbi:hypothetical protein E5Q_05314 [Mixia osmundae IAM 14324]|uniref:RNA helicase n=1 Tax=Mixia osmundae (strain CBS 9802 / IAM 14324 / JCM 22182 / KY 12970) TaxID=764103 RepID=G7E717_MIXOS|nr:hypothetical protein E5Q_05314 [Mixia osmundae IAM 14324]